MKAFLCRRITLLTIAAACAGLLLPALAAELAGSSLSAGSFTVAITDQRAYSEPAPVLSVAQWRQFMAGRSVFHRQWASIVSLDGDWGLGPTFVADRCVACHVNTGRGHPPASADEQPMSMLVRLSIAGSEVHGGPRPHPAYGHQLQNRSLDGSTVDLAHGGTPVPHEADVYIEWQQQEVLLADGTMVRLRKPKLRIENPAFGPLEGVMTSLRVAQPLVGIGFLDAVPEETILALAQSQRALGFDGRPNRVWDEVNQRNALGRYGWKANVPSLHQQTAAAAIADMGVNTNLYPEQNCPPVQTVCQKMLPGNFPELVDVEIDSLVLWMQALAVPARRGMSEAQVQLGKQLFERARCDVCHVPELVTAASFPQLPQLANQTFRAYTDLLLHDMGEGLADNRPDFQAGPRDWRTPPLWGLGLSKTVTGGSTLLHDGRARNVTEAILWHGGEAEGSRNAFSRMTKRERDALVRFVEAI
jgi:CxxC motif-containing protein (DUF1111 family)